MKLNLGCGYNHFKGFINVDKDPNCNPDILWDIEQKPWPFEDNSIDHIQAYHVVEHLGDPGFFNFMQEMYRVCKPGASIDIVVPHHRHDAFLNDPTHKRPITIEGLRLFSKKYNKHCIETGDGASKLGIYYNVDFEIVDFKMNFDPLYYPLLQDVDEEKEKMIQMIIRERNNVIVDVQIILTVIKE